MHVLNKRILTFAAFFLMAGILIAYYCGMDNADCFFMLIIAATGAGIYVLIAKKIFIPIMIFFLLLGNFLFINQLYTDFKNIQPHTEYAITGRVCDYPDKSGENARYVLDDIAINDAGNEVSFSKRVLLRTPDHSFSYGDIITFRAVIYRPQGETMPGSFNNQVYLASRFIGFSAYSEKVQKIGYRFMPYEIFVNARALLEENIDLTHSSTTAPIAKAMFLGIKNEIPDEIIDSFSNTGISHILAISGLHIGIIALLLNFLLKKTNLNRDMRFILNILLLVLYASVTGFPISVIRAGLMTIFILIGRWKFHERDTLIFLSAALLLILMVNPVQLFMPGFLLSFGTVFGILCLYPPLKRVLKNKKTETTNPAGKMLCVSVSASAASYPMTAYYFHNIAWIAPLANFIAIPSATIIVIFTGLAAFTAFISVAAGKLLAVVSESFINFIVVTNHFIARSGFSDLHIYRFPVWIGISAFAAIFIASDYFMLRKKMKAIMLSVLFTVTVLLAVVPNTGNKMIITFLDVGYGEATHIQYMDQNILITNATESAAYDIDAYSEENGLTYDLLVLTEGGKSHDDGAIAIIESGRVRGEVCYAKASDDIRETCCDLGIEMREAKKYDKLIDNEDFDLIVLNDQYDALTLLAVWQEKNVCLFSGHSANRSKDITASAPVLRVASEGNEHSVNKSFLQAVKPEYAVISVNDNPYGLPDPNTIQLLQSGGTQVFCTDQNYSVIMTVNQDDTLTMRPMNED